MDCNLIAHRLEENKKGFDSLKLLMLAKSCCFFSSLRMYYWCTYIKVLALKEAVGQWFDFILTVH